MTNRPATSPKWFCYLDLDLLGHDTRKEMKHVPQMVVKNSDASHGRIHKKSSKTTKISETKMVYISNNVTFQSQPLSTEPYIYGKQLCNIEITPKGPFGDPLKKCCSRHPPMGIHWTQIGSISHLKTPTTFHMYLQVASLWAGLEGVGPCWAEGFSCIS